jgi:hypothetical protein
MWLRLVRRRRDRPRGQSVVEFALILPLMLFLFLGIVDLGRVYTSMIGVESAAREAADFGTTLGAGRWADTSADITVAEMRTRACTAANTLPDFVGTDESCANPSFSYCVSPDNAATWICDAPPDPAYECHEPGRDAPDWPGPCRVRVTLEYDFNLIIPVSFEAFGVRYGLPPSLTIRRSSTFAMTDLERAP